MPQVSVVIPTYNAIAYLPDTVASVLEQTYPDFELLIVDDGSSDRTVEWVSALTDARVRLITQENQGSAGARNRGIAESQGEYIAFLDADDLWAPTKLEKQVRCLEADPAVGLVNTWVVNMDAAGNLTDQVLMSDAEGEIWQAIAEENQIFCGSSPMVRRSCFETVGVFDQTLRSAEDWDMWIRIAARYHFAVVKEPLVFYRQHANSKSNNLQRHLNHRLKVIDKTFASASPELQHLKNRAYGRAHLSVAWKPLLAKDYDTALSLRRQALTYYPQLRSTKSYLRLGLIITAMRWLGPQGYQKLRNLLHTLRKQKPWLKQEVPG
ncbi:glycosyltransferase [Trichocoleus sp. FACHB-591]|uniref:glycosyltransferase family 2 protein n=1 Tax=Trichocoleus sp. FACHB-591 TaxID=2692872 RepID=UPI001685E0ED|nr:glycosyltransferase [Trichocoleus sp. FACHB-591]MBD2095429.1 glycosyltransferase [Trichocoleus sp. FACHB-591]